LKLLNLRRLYSLVYVKIDYNTITIHKNACACIYVYMYTVYMHLYVRYIHTRAV